MNEIKAMIEKYKKAYRNIKNATNYTTSYLKFGNACDSSDNAQISIDFVLEAQEIFINQHKQEILKLAADTIKEKLKEVGVELND